MTSRSDTYTFFDVLVLFPARRKFWKMMELRRYGICSMPVVRMKDNFKNDHGRRVEVLKVTSVVEELETFS